MAKGMNIRGNRQLKKPKQPKKVPAVVSIASTNDVFRSSASTSTGTTKKS